MSMGDGIRGWQPAILTYPEVCIVLRRLCSTISPVFLVLMESISFSEWVKNACCFKLAHYTVHVTELLINEL